MTPPGIPESALARFSPPRVYQSFILAMIACYLLFPATRWLSFPVNLLGLPVFLGGAWLAIAAKRYFQRHQTRLAIGAIPASLHTDFVYRYSRNPMYLGIGIGLAGLALLLSSWLNLVFPAMFVLLMDRFYIPREEQLLVAHFGQGYVSYQQRVRRWL